MHSPQQFQQNALFSLYVTIAAVILFILIPISNNLKTLIYKKYFRLYKHYKREFNTKNRTILFTSLPHDFKAFYCTSPLTHYLILTIIISTFNETNLAYTVILVFIDFHPVNPIVN